MNSIDFTPLYRSSIGFDRLVPFLDSAFNQDTPSTGFPPYNIEVIDDTHYAITLAVAGFAREDLDVQVENNTLIIRGAQSGADDRKRYLHQGIANRSFERKYQLAEYVEVTNATLKDGLLVVDLKKEIPEAMKPRSIRINSSPSIVEARQEAA